MATAENKDDNANVPAALVQNVYVESKEISGEEVKGYDFN